MGYAGGVLVVAAIGLGVFIGGIVFVVMGVRGRFLNDLDTERTVVTGPARVIGLLGYISKGIAFMAIGVLFMIAAYQTDPEEAGGLDGALESLRRLPSGNVVLTAIAIGFILFGLYCFIRAKYEKLEAPAGAKKWWQRA